jgi:Fe-S-cluster containining protein
MPFNRCAECQRCCNVDPGYPALDITLTASETKKFGHLCIQGDCDHLGASGCVLADEKPFSCKLYPLSFNPTSGNLYFDVECPLMPDYIDQLNQPHSNASRHFNGMVSELRNLIKTDLNFLKKNSEVDRDYFELKKMPNQPLKKEIKK